MIGHVSAHRRANAFAQALEDQNLQDTAAEQQPDPEGLLSLANSIGARPTPELDPEVKVVQRAQLVAAMEAMFAEGGASAGPQVPEQRTGRGAHRATSLRKLRPRSRWSKGIAAGGLTVGVAAGAFSGVAAASSNALPGDSLYGLKRGMEDLKLGMADNNADRGEIYLDQASTRLQEARRLMERDKAGQLDHEQLGEVRRALTGMKHDATEGHRLLHEAYARNGALGPIQALSSFAQSHRDTWSQLQRRLPAQLTDMSNEVNSVFDAIDQEVAPLQSLLPSPPGRSTGRTGTGGSTTDSTGTTHPSTSSAPTHGGSTTGNTPHPSASGSTGTGGLIGGNTGGLLNPPETGTSSTPATGKDGKKTTPPDVTLPPLLPGLLPGLGIDGEDAK
ncbi:DUF5667 domain-containing protein [Streptomyces sp. NBC_01465]|uniref:DUF5667 domain-containing protein n=1 Tax=Streptomyces sp. NBC_01465 TaxID=2903878 RepID=UPI002E311FDE|nr:DUF5667 domain-containing protein [Streptomyces sp. NBC_01465]